MFLTLQLSQYFEKVEVLYKDVHYRLICRPTGTTDFQQNNLFDEWAVITNYSVKIKKNKHSFHGPHLQPISYNPGVTPGEPSKDGYIATYSPLSSPSDSTQCISLLHFLRSQKASSFCKPGVPKSFSITSLHVLFDMGIRPSTSKFILVELFYVAFILLPACAR